MLPSWILNSAIFEIGVPECPTASMRQIWLKSVKRLRSYHDLTIFESVRRRHLGFLKIQFFNDGTLETPNLRDPVNFIKIGRFVAKM